MKKVEDMLRDMKTNKQSYEFFDVNCWLPFNTEDTFSHLNSMDEFLYELSSFGIKKAVVSNKRSFSCSPFVGNNELLSLVDKYEKLYAGAVLAPEAGFSPNDMRKYIDGLIKSKVVLARMFPGKLNHSLKKWQVGDILEYLEYKCLPLMLWHTETDWDTINEICTEYPGLPVIIEGNDKKLLYHNRAYVPLLMKHRNLYIETHNFVQYLGFEYIAGELGIDRFLFGSYFPYNDPHSAMLLIMTADIDYPKKHMIAGGNLTGLLKNIRYE